MKRIAVVVGIIMVLVPALVLARGNETQNGTTSSAYITQTIHLPPCPDGFGEIEIEVPDSWSNTRFGGTLKVECGKVTRQPTTEKETKP